MTQRWIRRGSCLLAGAWLALWPHLGWGQAAPPEQPAGVAGPVAPAAGTAPQAAPRFTDLVTVSATLNPSVVDHTPGTVAVIEAEEIERRQLETTSDLLIFQPGVYIEAGLTRVGANGFNIRGIGGNRVMTQVDGVETSEQFDFGPFNVHQLALDLDALKSVEIVKSAGSSLYGSDALGGVVSFFTKDPADYLRDRGFHAAAKATFDGRSDTASGHLVVAGGGTRVKASLFVSSALGHEVDNQGTVAAEDARRTRLDPQDRRSHQAVGKLVFEPSAGNTLRGTFELADNHIETEAFSSRATSVAGPTTTTVADVDADDTLRRWRVSIDQHLDGRAGLDQWFWRAFVQRSDTDQVVDELRVSASPTRRQTVSRSGSLTYDQDSVGGELQGRKALRAGTSTLLATFGASVKRDTFDMLRDRIDIDVATGAIVPTTALILPTKYFPRSRVSELGAYVQGEWHRGRLRLVPGLRVDRFALDAQRDDQVFNATLSPTPVDFVASHASGRFGLVLEATRALTVHTQYAGGFRAPPYSTVNSGFTNLAGGYTSLPNPDLRPETSHNLEAGLRWSTRRVRASVTGFTNLYDDFILQADRGTNAQTGLLEYQYQNVAKVRIRGLELQAELRLGDAWRARASYARIAGDDTTTAEDVPLSSIAPDQGAFGLAYTRPSQRFGADFVTRFARAQSARTAGAGLFAPSSYAVADLTGWVDLVRDLKARVGVLNLADTKYFEWTNVRGRRADPLLERYSNPGRSLVASLSVGW